MTQYYQAKDAAPSDWLRTAFGEYVVLEDGGRESAELRVLREFRLEERVYAVLQRQDAASDDYSLYRVQRDADGTLALESIDDDEEWDIVAEVYDELTLDL